MADSDITIYELSPYAQHRRMRVRPFVSDDCGGNWLAGIQGPAEWRH